MQLVEIVARHAKFHSSQDRTNQSTAMNVFQTINQKLKITNTSCFIRS